MIECPFKADMERVAAALNLCEGWTLKQRRDVLEGAKKAVCGAHCAIVCKLYTPELR